MKDELNEKYRQTVMTRNLRLSACRADERQDILHEYDLKMRAIGEQLKEIEEQLKEIEE